jgi:lysine 2,3-aminomutase
MQNNRKETLQMQDSRSCSIGDDNCDEPPPERCTVALEAATADSGLPELPTLVPSVQWNDWRWQMKNRIRSLADLHNRFPSVSLTPGMASAAGKFPMAITPYYASLMRGMDSRDPIFLQAVPQGQEMFDPPCLKDDPLEEDEDMPVPGLVHRYPDRALLIATSTCSMYCRHCTRKRVAGHRETRISALRLQQVKEYLTAHPEISDVIVSGGDPFTMTNSALEQVLATIRAVPSVDIIRIGTRTPVVLPMRITPELVRMLRKYHPIFVNTHFNHPAEVTPEAAEACTRLADAGIPMGNQSVLLRGVNDDPQVLEKLYRALVRIRVKPYYLFQCDLVRGVEHFRTPLSRGIEIMEYLRGRLSGLAIPNYVVDAPHGGGKIPVLPTYIVSMSPSQTVLRNFEGMMVAYPEPADLSLAAPPPERPVSAAPTVWDLAAGRSTRIQPSHSARHDRREARALNPVEHAV